MSTAFIGLTVVVKLKSPPVALQGLVADVQGQRLYLHNVVFLASGKKLNEYTVHGLEIEDIEVVKEDVKEEVVAEEQEADGGEYEYKNDTVEIDAPRSLQSPSGIHPTHTVVLRPAQVLPSKQFVDPAILSYGRRPSKVSLQTPGSDAPSSHRLAASSVFTAPAQDVSSHTTNSQKRTYHHHEPHESHTKTFDYLVFDNETHEVDQAEVVVTADGASSRNNSVSLEAPASAAAAAATTVTISNASISNGKTKQRANKKKKRQDIPYVPSTADDPLSSPELTKTHPQTATDSNGWRQTPILQEPSAFIAKSANKTRAATTNKSRRQRALEVEQAQNGWATEDATDVQELGDFDFERNLANFDKKTVFDQLREADTTADEDRLVSFNRLPPRPGTFGGKNLHPSEMVLDSTRPAVRRGSRDIVVHQDIGNGFGKRSSTGGGHMSESSDVEAGERNGSMSSSRLLKRDFSRTSARAVPMSVSSRKSSGVVPATSEQMQHSTSQLPPPHHHHHHHHILQSTTPPILVARGTKPGLQTQVVPGQQQVIPAMQRQSPTRLEFQTESPVSMSQAQKQSPSTLPVLPLLRRQQQQQQQQPHEHQHHHHHHHHHQHEQDQQQQTLQTLHGASAATAPHLQPQTTLSPIHSPALQPLPLTMSQKTLDQLEEWAKAQVRAGEAILSLVETVRAGRG